MRHQTGPSLRVPLWAGPASEGRSQERLLETALCVDFHRKRSMFLCLSKASWLIYAYAQVEMFPEPEPRLQISVNPGSLKSKRIQEAEARRLLVKAEEAV